MSDAGTIPVPAVTVAPGVPTEPPATVVEPVAAEPTLPTSSLIGGDVPTPEPVAAEPAAEPVAAAPVEPAAPADPAAPAPVDPAVAAEPIAAPPIAYEVFQFPEGLVVAPDDPGLTKFNEIAGGAGLPQEKAQELINLYGEAANKYAEDLQQHLVQRQFDVFGETVKGWEQQFRESPEFKNRIDTVIKDAKWAINDELGIGGSTPEQRQELRDALNASGMGSHPAIIRAFANAAKRLQEARPGPRPAPTTSRGGSAADRRYGAMKENS